MVTDHHPVLIVGRVGCLSGGTPSGGERRNRCASSGKDAT
jgi:hypothetical protein